MSLAITLANPYGIVMSADRRLTTTVTHSKTEEIESFLLTEHEQKLFLTKAGHGISYTGASSLEEGKSTSCIINKTLVQLGENLSLEDEILSIKKKLQSFSNGQNVILIGAAICNEKNYVLSSSLIANEITELTDKDGNCLAFSGESEIVIKLMDMLPVDRNAFPLQESINYLRFLTRSVAGLQHYAQISQTVSEDCDILVIRDSGAQWITSPDTLS